ncbi:MAG: response regulator, partial [Oligoflexales bacterium]|nr:response regulator [Oligoflexales bacterium]
EYKEDEYEPKQWQLADVATSDENLNVDSDRTDTKIEPREETILVVDDMIDMVKLISTILKNNGYKVETATDGSQALEICKRNKPDLIVVDWMMPVMSGPELIANLKYDQYLASIPTIMLTAKHDEESKREGTSMGADGYLGKPFDQNELLSLIKNLIILKRGEKRIADLNRELADSVLRRFLPPELVESILKGNAVFDTKPKNTTVTVLISSICNFKNVLEMQGPEKVSNLLTEYFSQMTEIIFKHKGIVDRFEDGSIRAIFGIPTEKQPAEQVLSACCCALEMKKALIDMQTNWNSIYEQKFDIKMAVHSGRAIVGNIGSAMRSDYTAIGHAVITARKIESIAKEDEILISDRVRDLLPANMWVKHGRYNFEEEQGATIVAKLVEPAETEAA